MPNRVRTLLLADDDRAVLLRRVRAKGAPAREVERARIVLLAADGVPGVWFPPNRGGFLYAASRSGAAVFS
jgi:hypothetical protein